MPVGRYLPPLGTWAEREKKRVRAMPNDTAEDFGKYVETAGRALLAAMSVYDLAVASNKMLSWDCIGEENNAWKEGPFISSGKGEEQIDRSRPYCLVVSKEFSVSISLVLGPNPKVESNGGCKLPSDEGAEQFGAAKRTISKLIIIEQFEIFKDFWVKHDGPINAKQARKWRGLGYDGYLDHLETLTNRRNELVHGDPALPPTIREAVDFYFGLRVISESLAQAPATTDEVIRKLTETNQSRNN